MPMKTMWRCSFMNIKGMFGRMRFKEGKGERKMNRMQIEEGRSRILWTRQSPELRRELERSGRYRVKQEYLEKKNGNMSSYYDRLYRWYTRAASRILDTGGALYPIWFNLTRDRMLQPVEGSEILAVELPAEAYLLCNYEAWGYVVNFFYVALSREDEERHRAELRKNGLKSDDELFLTEKGNFYPILKREVEKSWERIFTLRPDDTERGVAATSWELRSEWIREVRSYEKGALDGPG